jgi:hypothetical protein
VFAGDGWTLKTDRHSSIALLTLSKTLDTLINASWKAMDSAVVGSLEIEKYWLK